jgi:enoyl-CoA hydratase
LSTVEAKAEAPAPAAEPVLYEKRGKVGIVTLNRPEAANAQNERLLYALDAALMQGVEDDEVAAIVLCGAGKHFSSGHDMRQSQDPWVRDVDRKMPWYDWRGKPITESFYAREQEVFLGFCRRWRDIPKPTIAAVQGACIAGGLMLAWICDLIVASEDAYFADPVVTMGVPGVEYFAHPFEMPTRIAREFLMLGERMPAQRAYEVGMVNRVVPRERLFDEALAIGERLAERPRFALALTKQAFNFIDDVQGRRTGMEGVFAMHHLAHAHNNIQQGMGVTTRSTPVIKASIERK